MHLLAFPASRRHSFSTAAAFCRSQASANAVAHARATSSDEPVAPTAAEVVEVTPEDAGQLLRQLP